MRVISATIFLVYCILLLTPLCFCMNCPLERVDLTSHSPPPPHSSHLPSTDFSADRQCLEGEVWGQGDGLPRPHATSWKGDRQCLGGGEDWGQGDRLPRPHATSWKGDHQSWRGKGEGGGNVYAHLKIFAYIKIFAYM
jgi:hypothetical protein